MLTADDRLDIQELYARYNQALDLGNSAGWAATFTADGTFTSGPNSFAGPDQLKGFAEGFASRLKARHWTNNLILDEADGGVNGSCYLVLFLLTPGEKPPAGVLTTGIYHDRVVRTDSGWRFASRAVTPDA